MAQNRFDRRGSALHQDPKIGRMVLLSLTLHLILVLVFAGVLIPRLPHVSRPVYYVDLVNMPVNNPQAGRPQAPVPKKKAPAPPQTPSKPEPQPAVHHQETQAAKVLVPAKPAPKPKPHPKPESKPEPKPEPKPKPTPKPKDTESDYQATLKRIEAMKREQKIAALKRQLAGLAKDDSRNTPTTDAPVGMPTGHGDQAGPSHRAWIHQKLKKLWALSRYQVSNNINLSATVSLTFNSEGALVDYHFVKPSGNARFDQSVKKAILDLPKLPNPPDSSLTLEIVFNLKDLMD